MGQRKKITQPPRRQVEESLAALLKRGQPGDRLPAEPVLAAQLGVSRATLRETLRLFAERGLVERRHGVGTFIAPASPVAESGLEVLESIESMAGRLGLKTRLGAALLEERPARPDELKGLERKSATMVLYVARTILANGRPVAHLVDAVPVEYLRASDLGDGFNGSVLDPLLERGGLTLAYSHTSLAATSADATLAKQLRVQRGAPLLRLEAQLYAQDGQVIDYSIGHFVPARFRFHVVRRVGA